MNLSFQPASIYVSKEPVDLRKGVESLAAIAADFFGVNPHDQSLYIFTNKAHNRLKCLFYDGTGFWMFYRKLNSGHFNWKMTGEGLVSLNEEQLSWLLKGLSADTGTIFPECHPLLY